jgi:hypothetical protein
LLNKENNRNLGNITTQFQPLVHIEKPTQISSSLVPDDDTEEFIKKVSSRFEEAKKLMNESSIYKRY